MVARTSFESSSRGFIISSEVYPGLSTDESAISTKYIV